MHDLMMATRNQSNMNTIIQQSQKSIVPPGATETIVTANGITPVIGSRTLLKDAAGDSQSSTIVQPPTGLQLNKLESLFSDDDEC